jgi:hypothetical protein
LLDPELRKPFDQLDGNRLREREPDGAFAELIGFQFALECRGDGVVDWIKRVVMLPAGEEEYGSAIQFVRRNLVRDRFLGGGTAFRIVLRTSLRMPRRSLGFDAIYSLTDLTSVLAMVVQPSTRVSGVCVR